MESNLRARPGAREGQVGEEAAHRPSATSDRKAQQFPPDAIALDERLQRLDRLANAGTMAASLAHEIKNAMVAVRTFVEMLLVRNQDAELAGIVKREMLRIDSIASQLLRLAASPKASFAEVRLDEVLDRTLRLIEPQLKTRGIRLRKDFRANGALLEADSHRLEQAFTNLFLNSIEAIGRNGELAITTALAPKPAGTKSPKGDGGSTVRITIRDSGVGIPRKEVALLFEPFFTTKPNGTGLGLPITQEIIHQHGGTISVQSAPGKGTTFSITLPLVATKQPLARREK